MLNPKKKIFTLNILSLILLLLFLILLLKLFIPTNNINEGASRDSNDNILEKLDHHVFLSLENMWHEEGFWGEAKQNMDNRYNEAIVFYDYYGKKYKKNFEDKLEKSINFSLSYLRGANGGFLQENEESYMRTAMFIRGISETIRKYELNNEDKILDRLNLSISYLVNNMPHPSSISNQDIVAMVAFYELYLTTQKEEYFKLYKQMHDYLIKNFIFVNNEMGYWPEAPIDWTTRINVPYLQVQIMHLGFYLNELKRDDQKMLVLFNLLINQYANLLDLDNLSLNVKGSLGPHVGDNVSIQVPSVFWFSCNLTGKFCDITEKRREEVIKKTYFENLNSNYCDILLATNYFYRFGIITEFK